MTAEGGMSMVEKQLYQAFDHQRFAENSRLQAVIDAVHRRTADRELSDDELDMVAAAGVQEPAKKPKENSK